MTIQHLLTPITEIHWLFASDTVRDAFDHLETYELTAAPMLDWSGRYLGTVTEADLRRHLANGEREAALATRLTEIERRARNLPVTIDCDAETLVFHAASHLFVPVVDDCDRLLGIIDRKRITRTLLPTAA
ncbi:MAG: CBS domain-containing protein [Kofleriaceae bacterium]|nr:CBS domain-containing protein [Kofleriaceae bacterium]